MQKRLALTTLAILSFCALGAIPASAGVESLLGKWQVRAEGPNGPMDLEFAFRLEGDQIMGTATTERGSAPLSAIKFVEPDLAMDLVVGDSTYHLKAAMKAGSLEGTWERVGTEMKGVWTAKRGAPPETASPAGGILGHWSTVAVTPNGEMAANLEIKQAEDKFSGVISSDMGSMPVQAVSFKENKLQFDIELGGNVYRIQAALEGDKLNGNWAPAAGGDGGPWRATRKAPAESPAPDVVGSWNVVAATPEGNLQFIAELAQSGQVLKGTLKAPDGSIEMKNVAYAGGTLTFEVDYMGGTYRIQATLAGDKMTGKWAAMSGNENGTLTGERKKP